MVVWGWGGWKEPKVGECHLSQGFFGGYKKFMKYSSVGCTTECTKIHWTVHIKWVNCMLHELHLNKTLIWIRAFRENHLCDSVISCKKTQKLKEGRTGQWTCLQKRWRARDWGKIWVTNRKSASEKLSHKVCPH
jgi:hypothetical protein